MLTAFKYSLFTLPEIANTLRAHPFNSNLRDAPPLLRGAIPSSCVQFLRRSRTIDPFYGRTEMHGSEIPPMRCFGRYTTAHSSTGYVSKFLK